MNSDQGDSETEAVSKAPAPRRRPPSHDKYQKAHPIISLHVSQQVKATIDQQKGNESYGKFVTKLVTDFKGEVQKETKKQLAPIQAQYIAQAQSASARHQAQLQTVQAQHRAQLQRKEEEMGRLKREMEHQIQEELEGLPCFICRRPLRESKTWAASHQPCLEKRLLLSCLP